MSFTKQQKIDNFDPNGIWLLENQIFWLPFDENEADIVLIPVPRDVTVSYGGGTAHGPEALLEESFQVDLHIPGQPDARQRGIVMLESDQTIATNSSHYRSKAEELIEQQANGESLENLQSSLHEINQSCAEMVKRVREESNKYLEQNKVVWLIGGDHSTPLGLIQSCAEHYHDFGILQIDAHCDLRDAYEWFEYSHASIMTNALKTSQVTKLVQVGIRDYCKEEVDVIENSNSRITTFFDKELKQQSYQWITRAQQVKEIINHLPDHVYLSFDIDGLDPKLCPNTGTPVAGGFETEQVIFLIEQVVASGRTIIAFDINEIGNDPRDANVAARLLYQIANLVRISQHR